MGEPNYEAMEEKYQKEHEKKPYSKQEYAKNMHEKELAEMAEQTSHMTVEERRKHRNAQIATHRWDMGAYCKKYSQMLKEHEAAK